MSIVSRTWALNSVASRVSASVARERKPVLVRDSAEAALEKGNISLLDNKLNKSRYRKRSTFACRLRRFLAVCAVLTVTIHRLLSHMAANLSWQHHPIHHIERPCPVPSYQTLKDDPSQAGKICIATLTDSRRQSLLQYFFRWRNYDDVLDLTWPNAQHYANKHGYQLFDESHVLHTSRPAAWSKVLAARRLLHQEDCTWVMWMDADVLFMDSDKRLSDFLPADASKDLVVTQDIDGGYNSGVWFVRNTDWSRRLIDEWWSMKSFVRLPGFSKSGDQHALSALLEKMNDMRNHVLIPPRCTFNSFARFVAPSDYERTAEQIKSNEFYLNQGYYHKGDFIAHAAGYDNKGATLLLLLQLAK